jgi:myo-inositol-1(or 4)-monophosphatase
MNPDSTTVVLLRIEEALEAAVESIRPLLLAKIDTEYKPGNQVVTAADREANRVLRNILVRSNEGWLSEESTDDFTRLQKRRVWIVDPLDGTREFVAGIPEWSISVGLIEDGKPIAGGVCNPATRETFIGSMAAGVFYNGKSCRPTGKTTLSSAQILVSRSEFEAGEWECIGDSPFTVKPIGSIAYKLALVAAGRADATLTLRPKHEWDVAGGVALVRAAGGHVRQLSKQRLVFNQRLPLFPNLIASGFGIALMLISKDLDAKRRNFLSQGA